MSKRRVPLVSIPSRRSPDIERIIKANSSQTASPEVYSPGYGLLDGGDTLVRCSDGIRFILASTLLASSFPRLLGEPPGPPSLAFSIEFPFSSDVLVLILKFISNRPFQPPRNKCTSSFVSDCFKAANMYQLTSLTAWLRSQLVLLNSPVYQGIGPIGAYGLCSTYQFRPEKQQAFRNCIGQINLQDKFAISDVTRDCPDLHSALELVGRLARRNIIITEVFSWFHTYPLDSRSCYWDKNYPAAYKDLTCKSCRDWTIFQTPSWLSFWAYRAKKEFLMTPGDDCDHVFRVEYLGKRGTDFEMFGGEFEADEAGRMEDEESLCQDCLKRILLENPSHWEDWATIVQNELKVKLADEF
ncbi:unnamed protein product [Rhizoctonia solani]|uniref:BTB domain-containing protein n=1 Tax=Rhizoctonia solani TaxID=456999 RepID=A0A8H2WTY8_9AGAM|nr:unnamed protein product [Rhizoctonia solani]